MAVHLTSPWLPLDMAAVADLPGQLGVYELRDAAGETCYIGFAGGRSLFGLRGEVEAQLGSAAEFRFEVTAAYQTRHRELLMAFHAAEGRYPPRNASADTEGLGRLSPLQAGRR